MAEPRLQDKPNMAAPGFKLEIDPASVGIVLVMLFLFIVEGVVVAGRLSEMAAKGPAETVGILWLVKFLFLGVFFTLPVPLAMGAIWGVSRLTDHDLPGGIYSRAAALASVPLSLILLVSMLGTTIPLVIGLMIVALLTFIATKLIFKAPIQYAVLYFVASAPLILLGIYAGLLMVSPIEHNSQRASARAWAQRDAEREARNASLAQANESPTLVATETDPFADSTAQTAEATASDTDATPPTTEPAPEAVVATPTTAPAATPEARMAALRSQITTLRTRTRGSRLSRQAMSSTLDPLLAEAEALKAGRGSTPELRALDRDLRQLITTRDRLPSDTPDDSLFEPLQAPTTFPSVPAPPPEPAPAQIASAWAYNLVLPERAEVDLRSGDDAPEGIAWTARKDQRTSGLRLKLIPKTDTRQQRPWIVPRGFRPAEAGSLLVYSVGDPAAPASAANHPTVGLIGDIPFTRIPLDAPGQVEYVASVGDKWLIGTVLSGGRPSEIIDFDPAMHSLHVRSADEPVLKPVRAETLVSRVAQPRVAAALKDMPGAEDALLDQYEKLPDPAKAAAVGVLAQVATDKSLPLLEKLQNANGPQRAAVRDALARLVPDKYDKYSMAIADLKGNNPANRTEAIVMLGREDRDEKRADVTRALESIDNQIKGRDIPRYAATMAKWADSKTPINFIPKLEEKDAGQRELAMAVLSTMKERNAVGPIAKLLGTPTDTAKASAALLAMGPIAEDEVLKYVRMADPRVRMAAVRILEKIGSQRSLPALSIAAKDAKDAGFAAAAQSAYDAVRARFDAQRAATASESEPTTNPAPPVPQR